MSIATQNRSSELVAPRDTLIQPPKKKRRPRGKYKPRLATNIKVALEEVVQKSTSARRWMGLILDWTQEERTLVKAEIDVLIEAAPITAASKEMYRTWLIRLGELDHHMARLALEVSAIETELRDALESSRSAAPSGEGQGERK